MPSEEAFLKLGDFIGGMEIVGIRLDNTWPGWIGIHIKVLAFAREDGAVEYRRWDDLNSREEPVLAVLTEPPTLEEIIQIVIKAINYNSDVLATEILQYLRWGDQLWLQVVREQRTVSGATSMV